MDPVPADKKEMGLSTFVGYFTKEVPKGVKIEKGKSYDLTDGYGTKRVTIQAIRKIGGEIVIYYKFHKEDGTWAGKSQETFTTLETFKAQMLEYASLDSIEIPFPQESI